MDNVSLVLTQPRNPWPFPLVQRPTRIDDYICGFFEFLVTRQVLEGKLPAACFIIPSCADYLRTEAAILLQVILFSEVREVLMHFETSCILRLVIDSGFKRIGIVMARDVTGHTATWMTLVYVDHAKVSARQCKEHGVSRMKGKPTQDTGFRTILPPSSCFSRGSPSERSEMIAGACTRGINLPAQLQCRQPGPGAPHEWAALRDQILGHWMTS